MTTAKPPKLSSYQKSVYRRFLWSGRIMFGGACLFVTGSFAAFLVVAWRLDTYD
jgi:hypothetical protein